MMTSDKRIGMSGLAPAKQLELQRAIDEAGGDMAPAAPPAANLTPAQPAPGLAPDAAQRDMVQQDMARNLAPASPAAAADLLILRHRDSGCIQFALPLPPPASPAQAPRSLTPAGLADSARWIQQAALRAAGQMTQSAIEAIEARNKPERLLSLRHGYRQPATAAELAAARGQRVLLFVHGVFSSTEGAFMQLGDGAGMAADTAMAALAARYQGQVFGYDHWTIAKTPAQNALDLLRLIPADAGWRLDLVCHSRGGLVVRSLLADVAAGGVPGDPGDAELAGIAALRAGRIDAVGKVFYVAAANQGSPLASPRELRQFLNVAAMLASFSPGMALDIVIGLARMVVSLGFARPSVQAMAGGSPLIAALNRHGSIAAPDAVYYARANFDFGDSALSNAGDLLDRLLLDADSDLVVPYASVLLPAATAAATTPERMLSFGTAQRKQNRVWHTEFFSQPAMRDFLLRHLAA